MKKIILASIIVFSFSVLAQVEMPATTEDSDVIGTIQKTDPAAEAEIKKDFKSQKKQKKAKKSKSKN